MLSDSELLRAAVAIRTSAQAQLLEEALAERTGGEHRRPLGDIPNNFGLMGSGGSFDHKLIENVTNMQDAVLERTALAEFGSRDVVPYQSPREAARALLGATPPRDVADRLVVEFYEADDPAHLSRKITALFRDQGCGMTPDMIPRTIFQLGAGHKEDARWLQGAFGVGGKTTFRNCERAVLVSRRAPELRAPGQEDVIAITVMRWEARLKTKSATYLVSEPWVGPGHSAAPLAVPSGAMPEFEPGTLLILVNYHVEGFYRRRGGDERTFDTVLNTRLFEPVLPVRFGNRITERNRNEVSVPGSGVRRPGRLT